MIFGRAYPIQSAVLIRKQRLSAAAATGTLAATEAQDIVAFSGTVGNVVSGTLAVTESQDTSSIAGSVISSGSLVTTEGQDTAALVGNVNALGSLVASETPDVLSFSGFSDNPVTGTLVASESQDKAYFIDLMVGGRTASWRELYEKKHAHVPKLPPRQFDKVHPVEEIRKAAAKLSSAGGHARAAALSSTQRKQIATIAAKARWR